MPGRYRLTNKNLLWLLLSAVVTVVLWQFPVGQYLLYPFTILGTWFHEMGHGLTAVLLGGKFRYLQIFPNGSGLATHAGSLLFGSFGQALVAAGGPMGPPIAGSLFIFASRSRRAAKISLLLFGIVLALSVIIWIRTAFGMIVILLLAASVMIMGLRAESAAQVFAVQFLGVQACISTFRDFNYLFTAGGHIGEHYFPSDTSVIAEHLLLPYWFWGLLLAGFSLIILYRSLKAVYRLQSPLSMKAAEPPL